VGTTGPNSFARAFTTHALVVSRKVASNGVLYVANKARLLGMDLGSGLDSRHLPRLDVHAYAIPVVYVLRGKMHAVCNSWKLIATHAFKHGWNGNAHQMSCPSQFEHMQCCTYHRKP
jgi:hypothetical protein